MENHGREMTKKWITENPYCYRDPNYLHELRWLNSKDLEEEQKRLKKIGGKILAYAFLLMFTGIGLIGWAIIMPGFQMLCFMGVGMLISYSGMILLILSPDASGRHKGYGRIKEIETIKRDAIRIETISNQGEENNYFNDDLDQFK